MSAGRKMLSPDCWETWSPVRIRQSVRFHGTNCVVDAACASSMSAVGIGLDGTRVPGE